MCQYFQKHPVHTHLLKFYIYQYFQIKWTKSEKQVQFRGRWFLVPEFVPRSKLHKFMSTPLRLEPQHPGHQRSVAPAAAGQHIQPIQYLQLPPSDRQQCRSPMRHDNVACSAAVLTSPKDGRSVGGTEPSQSTDRTLPSNPESRREPDLAASAYGGPWCSLETVDALRLQSYDPGCSAAAAGATALGWRWLPVCTELKYQMQVCMYLCMYV